MPVAFNYATHAVDQRDGCIASASVNAAQQTSSSIGAALLDTIAASVTANHLTAHASEGAKRAMLEGFVTAGTWAAGILLVDALVITVLMNTARLEPQAVIEAAEPVLAHS